MAEENQMRNESLEEGHFQTADWCSTAGQPVVCGGISLEQTNGSAAEPVQDGRSEEIPVEKLWDKIVECEGETFFTAKKLSFTYRIKGGEMFTDRRERSITRSTFEKAYLKVKENPGTVRGPKALNVFGGPYVWAVLKQIGAI